jgi:hypothetical protein
MGGKGADADWRLGGLALDTRLGNTTRVPVGRGTYAGALQPCAFATGFHVVTDIDRGRRCGSIDAVGRHGALVGADTISLPSSHVRSDKFALCPESLLNRFCVFSSALLL